VNATTYSSAQRPALISYFTGKDGRTLIALAEQQGFTGKERDAETGLDYFGARYYSGAQGRWTSPDAPFADQNPADRQSWNLYAYVRNNPLTKIDSNGLWTLDAGVEANDGRLPGSSYTKIKPINDSPLRDPVIAVGKELMNGAAAEVGAATKSEMYFIENGVRRSVVSREAGLSDIPATIYRRASLLSQPLSNWINSIRRNRKSQWIYAI
jgi:RHS repeat-associated protein